MKLDPKLIRSLESILEKELIQYKTYLSLLEKEQTAVIRLKSEDVNDCAAKRGQVVEILATLRENRVAILTALTGSDGVRVSDFVATIPVPTERKRLTLLVAAIKETIARVDARSREFSHVLNFSLGLVNGEISILWSASQAVTRVYNASGTLTEGTQPAAPRAGSLLGEA
jgi:hypothetical protein